MQHSWDLCLNRQSCGLLFCLCAMSYQMSLTAKYFPHKDRKLSSSCCACVSVASRGPQGRTHSARMTRLLCTRKCRSPPARTVTVWIMWRSGRGEGCAKWSSEEQRPNTLCPQASGPGTTEGTHTHTQTVDSGGNILPH